MIIIMMRVFSVIGIMWVLRYGDALPRQLLPLGSMFCCSALFLEVVGLVSQVLSRFGKRCSSSWIWPLGHSGRVEEAGQGEHMQVEKALKDAFLETNQKCQELSLEA